MSAVAQLPVALVDVRGTYSAWQRAKEREEASRALFREAVLAARDAQLRLDEIADALGVTRQAVQKVLRTAAREIAEAEAAAIHYERQARKDEAHAMRGLGFTAKDRQCGVCHRFKSAPSALCDYCGDDPVTYNGSARDFDAAYSGGIR